MQETILSSPSLEGDDPYRQSSWLNYPTGARRRHGAPPGAGNLLFLRWPQQVAWFTAQTFRERDCLVVWRDGTAIRLFAWLFVPRTGHGPGATSSGRSAHKRTADRNAHLAVGVGMPGDLFRAAATHKSTNSASVCAGCLSSKQVRQRILKSRLRDQLLRYHRSSSVRLSTSSIV